jgi:hypothetical protein
LPFSDYELFGHVTLPPPKFSETHEIDPDVKETALEEYANWLTRKNRKAEAEEMRKRAKSIREQRKMNRP